MDFTPLKNSISIADDSSTNLPVNLYKPPIVYVSGGLLGDFIHQLSVINENYIKNMELL